MRILTFLRAWAAVALGCLPLLALLLVPQLMRSRAGSEALLMVGVLAMFAVLAAAVILAPIMSTLGAPVDRVWQPRTALGAARRVWRTRRRQAWLAFGLFVGIYVIGQIAGYALGSVVPYVRDNPAFAGDPAASRWIIDYPAYVLQASVLYVFTTLALAAYAARLRTLAVTATVSTRASSSREPAPTAGR